MNKCKYKFYKDADILDHLTLENDADIDEYSLKKVAPSEAKNPSPGELNVVYLHLTREEWKELGIRKSLWGQSRVIDGVVYCYGSWNENSDYQQSQYFDEPVKSMTELSIGLIHESGHGIAYLKNKEDLTHAYMYGYEEMRNDDDQERFEKTPDAIGLFNYLLDEDEHVNFYCIRTIDITKQWKRELQSASHIIHEAHFNEPKKKPVIESEVNINKQLFYPQEDYSWVDANGPQSIVLHTLLGTVEGSDAWLRDIGLSYHFMIKEDGEVRQIVEVDNAAWHSGVVSKPNKRARHFYGDINPNRRSIGIAFERNGEAELTKQQRQACTWIIKHLEKEVDTHFNDENIFAHCEITSYKPQEVADYRLEVLETLEGGKYPQNTKTRAELISERNRLQSKIMTLLSDWVSKLLNTLSGGRT